MPTTLASLLFLINGAIIRDVVFVGIQLVNRVSPSAVSSSRFAGGMMGT
jgi:hypothetical protein